jgi:hypothetical protein
LELRLVGVQSAELREGDGEKWSGECRVEGRRCGEKWREVERSGEKWREVKSHLHIDGQPLGLLGYGLHGYWDSGGSLGLGRGHAQSSSR